MKISPILHSLSIIKDLGQAILTFLILSNPFKWNLSKEKLIPYKNSSKLDGANYEDIISQWIFFKYPKNHIIVLTNINVDAKNIQFWAKVPKTDTLHFMKDVVILHCKDRTEVLRLIENIPSNFADAHGYSAGSLITYNKDL